MHRSDIGRFFRCMQMFNTIVPVGSLYEAELPGTVEYREQDRLVSIVAYCLNPNHYHFILRQEVENGISEYMKRLGGGYTWYFNNKYKRSGALFQGRFKSTHIDSDAYLRHLSAYVNLNYEVHQLGGSTAKLVKSSWNEYVTDDVGICKKDIVLGQFSDKKQYKNFAGEAINNVKKDREELEKLELGG